MVKRGYTTKKNRSFFSFHLCFYATQRPCWRWDTGLIGPSPRHTLSYGFVTAVVHSLRPLLAGHFFTHSEPFQGLSSFFFLPPLPTATVYFISARADAQDTGDEAVTCCLHPALHHQQLGLQIYFAVDCEHSRSWKDGAASALWRAHFTFPRCV